MNDGVTWKYILIKDRNGWVRVAEYFGTEYGHTIDPLEVIAESKKEIIEMLETMLKDIRRCKIKIEN